MIYGIVICAGLLFITAMIHSMSRDEWSYFFTIIFTWVLSGLVIAYNDDGPKAMDVYQGKTTLEYTYRDGVAIDSVVVFKEE